jgi:hypothetical protein
VLRDGFRLLEAKKNIAQRHRCVKRSKRERNVILIREISRHGSDIVTLERYWQNFMSRVNAALSIPPEVLR